MSDEEKILAAVRSFDFSDYGCDDMDEFVSDPDLDVGPHLAAHIARALQEEPHEADGLRVASARGEVITEILAEFGSHYCDDPACESYVRIPTTRLTSWRKRSELTPPGGQP